jgi:uncharacterized spore protein YtfJ
MVEQMQSEQSVENQKTNPKPNSAAEFIGGLADRLGATARASTIFADPVERDGLTIIPAARARWGFGGGVGRKRDEDGAGGGGGAQVTPVGYIAMKNGEAEFRPIRTFPFRWVILSSLATLFLLSQTCSRRDKN